MFALLLLSVIPRPDMRVQERADLTELNHFYDDNGKLVFDQTIFYDWSVADERYHVRAWRLMKNAPAELTHRDWLRGGYRTTWHDSGSEIITDVWSPEYRETWTQYDPELVEREYLPKEKRKELRKK